MFWLVGFNQELTRDACFDQSDLKLWAWSRGGGPASCLVRGPYWHLGSCHLGQVSHPSHPPPVYCIQRCVARPNEAHCLTFSSGLSLQAGSLTVMERALLQLSPQSLSSCTLLSSLVSGQVRSNNFISNNQSDTCPSPLGSRSGCGEEVMLMWWEDQTCLGRYWLLNSKPQSCYRHLVTTEGGRGDDM